MRRTTTTTLRHAAFLTALTLAAAPAAAQGSAASAPPAARSASGQTPRETREQWQRIPDIFVALRVAPGSRVADVGAGDGYFTERLAKHVGPGGRVFAVDVVESALAQLRRLVEGEKLANVELVLGEADDPRLPYGTLDAALVVNAYHEMVQHAPMLAGIRRALRPGGVLVIVDNAPTDSAAPRYRQTGEHQLALPLAEQDLREAGFEVVERVPGFVTQQHDGHTHRQWLLVGRRPGGE
jgi:ubiquinone/menaquinone biosynthesis C-methylase UbiE